MPTQRRSFIPFRHLLIKQSFRDLTHNWRRMDLGELTTAIWAAWRLSSLRHLYEHEWQTLDAMRTRKKRLELLRDRISESLQHH